MKEWEKVLGMECVFLAFRQSTNEFSQPSPNITSVHSLTKFAVEEVLNFVQQDLVAEDVMLLDVGDALFVWLGIHSNQQGNSCLKQ